jgi:(S)-mandelate dehydrogenase
LAVGYDGIVISNHGGRQLDGAISPMEVLPEFHGETGGRIPLLIDGGFRSGVDVLKAIALGASAVQLGRVMVYALATAGEMGVDHALNLFRAEIENAMALCGVTRLDQLDERSVRRPR